MIQIAGSAQRSYVFPAKLRDALAYYGDIGRSFRFLTYISVVHSYAAGQYRLLYNNLESGLYRVKIFCDVLAVVEEDRYLIRISPSERDPPVRAQAGLYSMTGQGFYSSEIHFSKCGEQTRIEYSIEMKASLPVPLTLRWIPDGLMNSIAQYRFYLHTDQVIDRFIEQSVLAYGIDSREE